MPNLFEIEPLTRSQVLLLLAVTALVLLLAAKLWLHLGGVNPLPVAIAPAAVATGIGLGLVLVAFSTVVYRFWPDYERSVDAYWQVLLSPLGWPDVFWLGLLPGLSEELLFRGVALPALGNNLSGLLLSSLAFGALHLAGKRTWPYAVWAGTMGLALGASALLTGNLLVPLLAHVCINLALGSLWKAQHPAAT